MDATGKLPGLAIGLGALALALTLGEILALLDIVQGLETDLSLEWTVVCMALPVSVLAQIILIAAIVSLRSRRAQPGVHSTST